jgi:hypothetical protein
VNVPVNRWSRHAVVAAGALVLMLTATPAQPGATGRWEGTIRRGTSALSIAIDLPAGAPRRRLCTAGAGYLSNADREARFAPTT